MSELFFRHPDGTFERVYSAKEMASARGILPEDFNRRKASGYTPSQDGQFGRTSYWLESQYANYKNSAEVTSKYRRKSARDGDLASDETCDTTPAARTPRTTTVGEALAMDHAADTGTADPPEATSFVPGSATT